MRSFFEMGFRRDFQRPMMGQLEFIPTIVGAALQAGAAVYGAHMQVTIARMQKQTQEEIQARQEAAAKAQQQAQQKQIEQQQATGSAGGAAPKIMGVDRDVVIIGGVGLALVVGVIAIVVSKSSGTPVQTAVAS
jgi:hypothetical protein